MILGQFIETSDIRAQPLYGFIQHVRYAFVDYECKMDPARLTREARKIVIEV